MDSRYRQLVVAEEARERLELLTPDGKRQCKVMPLGYLNSASTFVVMMMKLKM